MTRNLGKSSATTVVAIELSKQKQKPIVKSAQELGREIPCPICEEKGVVNCEICNGKAGSKCGKCKVLGTLIPDHRCERCGRVGDEIGKQYKLYNIKWWINSGGLNRGIAYLQAIDNLDLGCPLEKNKRYFARSRFCKSCSKEVLRLMCPICGNSTIPRIREYFDNCCPYCIGRSSIDCPQCLGCGLICCKSCDSKGFKGCNECQGTGKTTDILQKEV